MYFAVCKGSALKSQMARAYRQYVNSTKYELNDCYDSWSNDKEWAYHKCKRKAEEFKAHDFKIVSFNGWSFTLGYVFEKYGVTYFAYITLNHNYVIKLNLIK